MLSFLPGSRSALTGLCRAARLLSVMVAAFTITVALRAQEYEVDGTVELRLFKPDKSLWKDYEGTFRVNVKGCAWLIQVTETNDWGIPQRREVGTTDGKEMFEMVVPLKAGQIAPSGLATSNAIPVGNLDSSFTGHLWLMFASGCYYRTAAPGQLTPVFDWRATPYLNNRATMKAAWELIDGPGSLPSRVTYFESDDTPSAIYTVTGFTNAGAIKLPAGFHFSQPGTGHKEVSAIVTSVSPSCSRANLRPTLDQRVSMIDLRWHPDDPGVQFTAYQADYWPSVKQAQGIYFSTRSGAAGVPVHAPSKLMIVILVGLLIAPPVIIVLRKLRLRQNSKP